MSLPFYKQTDHHLGAPLTVLSRGRREIGNSVCRSARLDFPVLVYPSSYVEVYNRRFFLFSFPPRYVSLSKQCVLLHLRDRSWSSSSCFSIIVCLTRRVDRFKRRRGQRAPPRASCSSCHDRWCEERGSRTCGRVRYRSKVFESSSSVRAQSRRLKYSSRRYVVPVGVGHDEAEA